MTLILTPAHHRSRALHKVVTAFADANNLEAKDRRVIVGKAKAIATLVDVGTTTKKVATQELDALCSTVNGMTEVGQWPALITHYTNELRKELR